MPQLREVQQAFKAALLAQSPGVNALLRPSAVSAAALVDIHRNHFFRSLTKSLEATFPAVVSLTDQRFFAYLAHEFIVAHPPTSPCLSDYGSALPGFIDAFPACASLSYLGDVARLEWAIHAVFHADGDRPSQRLQSRFPVHMIWKVALDPDAPAVTLGGDTTFLIIYRTDGDSVVEAVDETTYLALPPLA